MGKGSSSKCKDNDHIRRESYGGNMKRKWTREAVIFHGSMTPHSKYSSINVGQSRPRRY